MGFFGKIFVLIAVIAAVWVGFRWWQRVQSGALDRPRRPASPDEGPVKPIDDMRRCPVCDDYVSINAKRCERPTCPRG
jgi:hypothetical protein